MLDDSEFRAIVSGQRVGAQAAALRGLLRAGEVPYSLAVRWRNRRFDRGHSTVHAVNVPVVSVGNLTLGGTGKTPLVKAVARWAIDRGIRPAIVSRGYKATRGQPNDEARELADALPTVIHVQNPDRVAAVRHVVGESAVELIILDDGFQHRRLGRDLDIVLLDALEPFGFDHVFPRGTLREPVGGLARAGVVCLSRADLVPPAQRDAIRGRVLDIAPRAAWCEAIHQPSYLTTSAGQRQSLDTLRGRRVAAFCGLGNPAGFRHTLTDTGCWIVAWREFPDHHSYSATDLAELARFADGADAELLVCTHKDLVKIEPESLNGRPLCALIVEMRFTVGEQEMLAALERVIV